MPSCRAPSRPCSRSTPESELDGVLGWQTQMLSPPLSAASHTRSIAYRGLVVARAAIRNFGEIGVPVCGRYQRTEAKRHWLVSKGIFC